MSSESSRPGAGTITVRGGRLAVPDRSATPGTGAASVRLEEGDLQIVDGRIEAIGHVGDDRGEVIDARGLVVMPGAIDPQVHFREPGNTHKEDIGSGSRACAAGGITSFIEMPNTNPPTTDAEALAWKHQRGQETSLVHWSFFIGATPGNTDDLLEHDADPAVPGIKVFMGSSTGTLLVSEQQDLERVFGNGRLPIAVHAEDEDRLNERIATLSGDDVKLHTVIRDAEAARLATERALALSDRFDRRLHVLHLSTADEVEMIRKHGKGAGRVTVEVTPQHLLLNSPEIYDRIGTRAQMNPPLRSAEHSEGLWRGLHDGTIDCIATDHAPHTLEEKALPYGKAPSGMPGVETSLAAMLDAASRGLCSVEQVIGWMTEGPARVWQIENKGRLEVGYDGDLTLVDLGLTRKIDDGPIRCRAGWNPFEGVPLRGWPIATIVAGVPVLRDGELAESSPARPLRFRGE